MSTWIVAFRPEAAADLDDLPRNLQLRILRAIDERLVTAPDRYGLPLRRMLFGLWKLRVGDYRIVYEVRGSHVMIWGIRHRKDVYERLLGRWNR